MHILTISNSSNNQYVVSVTIVVFTNISGTQTTC